MKSSRLWRRPILIVAVVALLIAGFAAFVVSNLNSSDDSLAAARNFDEFDGEFFAPSLAATDAPAAGAPAPPSEVAASDTLGTGGVVLASLQTINTGRDIIFRADLTVAVTDVASAGAEATTIVEALGGFLFGQQTTGGGQPRSVLTFKVLPDNFRAALDALGSIGEIRTQNISASDVTGQVVDLQSRISTAEISVDRLRDFLSNANDINAIAELERELLNRETTLETLRGQLRTVQDQVAQATIILTLTEDDVRPDMHLSVSTYLGHEDGGESCPGESEPRFVQGDKVTVCFEIFNTGDTSLAQFTLRDSVLDVDFDDLAVVFGDPELLEPGESLVLAVEIVVDRDLRTQTRVTAEPVKEETGEVITGRTVSRTETSFIFAEDPGGLPGFSDGLSASWDVMQNIGGLGILAAGAVLPFLWLLVLTGAFLWWRRRRATDGGDPETPDVEPR